MRLAESVRRYPSRTCFRAEMAGWQSARGAPGGWVCRCARPPAARARAGTAGRAPQRAAWHPLPAAAPALRCMRWHHIHADSCPTCMPDKASKRERVLNCMAWQDWCVLMPCTAPQAAVHACCIEPMPPLHCFTNRLPYVSGRLSSCALETGGVVQAARAHPWAAWA